MNNPGTDGGARLSRRMWIGESLRLGAISVAAGAAATARHASALNPTHYDLRSASKESLRIVHLTDVHLCARPSAIAGFEATLESIARLDPARAGAVASKPS